MRKHQQHKTTGPSINRLEPDLKSILENAERALFDAAAKGGANAARTAILLHHADVDARNSKKETPLMIAADGGHMDVVQVLKNAHACPFALDDDDLTARGRLEKAGGHEIMVRVLKTYESAWKKEHEEPEYPSSD